MDSQNVEVEDLLCDESFLRYCRGEDQSDITHWETWISKHPDKLPVVTIAKRLYASLNLGQGNRMEQLASLKNALIQHAQFRELLLNRQETALPKSARVIKLNRRSLVTYAASIIVLISLGVLAYTKYPKKDNGQLRYAEYFTRSHDHKTIMLPDSSIVMLNENSHLSVNKDFDAHHRQVSITGEALFVIKHDADNPFLVNTAQYKIKVLGTTFNVRSYPGADSSETTLLNGKIQITQGLGGDSKKEILLKPQQKFILKATASATTVQHTRVIPLNEGKVALTVVDTATHHFSETSWARKKMEINDRTFGEIAEQLQAWYGIKIKFADAAVREYRYTATFDDETIFKVLQYLQQSYPFTYTIQDDCVVVATDPVK